MIFDNSENTKRKVYNNFIRMFIIP